MRVLALNVGSSSLKVALFEDERCIERRSVGHVGEPPSALRDATRGMPPPDAIGHRLVHGGARYASPVRLDDATRRSLADLVPYAPLHLPAELAVVDAAIASFPRVPHVACFDTAFHRSLPEAAERLPLPRALYDEGVRRYGFHGLSYEYIVESVGARALGRAVLAHLGSGASMAAVQDGRSVDTTMGFTPTGGLVMSTRSGDLDPGVIVHLLDRRAYDARALEHLVNVESGLVGISGSTGDMKALLEDSPKDPRAALAVEIFCRSARKAVGALVTVLGGIDTLVFTGGIGERAAPVRAKICERLAHLGVHLDAGRNERGESPASTGASACKVLIVPTDEERMIARHVRRLTG